MEDQDVGAARQSIRRLTPQERERLLFFKWRYTLECDGFSPDQVKALLFLKWLQLRGRLRIDRPTETQPVSSA